MTNKHFTEYGNRKVPLIAGAKGGKGGSPSTAENTLFSTDVLFVANAIGEGPIYRINPNGPQDIQIQDSAIDDLIFIEGDGTENTEKFKTLSTSGTTTQAPLDVFGEDINRPQNFGSPTTLKKGNIDGVPASKITLQDTSANAWDILNFNFVINSLFNTDDKGNISKSSLTVKVTVFDSLSAGIIAEITREVTGKTDTSFKFSIRIAIPDADKSASGYKFSIEKLSDESKDTKDRDHIQIIGWNEIENSKQSYPRTALIGYAIKAVDEHTGGVPNFTSVVKGLIVKTPSNYNQPILSNGEIDWRQLEVATTGVYGYTTNGYRLAKSGPSSVLTDVNPQIYVGTWDGTFVYSWSQNPVWIVYDILTNNTYGLGIPEANIDKFKFYQVAQYCDACDSITGKFMGVSGMADGSFRYKPNNLFTSVKENQIGMDPGSVVQERRFISDLSVVDQELSMDLLNKITSTFRSILTYAGGKISLAIDMPEEYPVMLFNESNIQEKSFHISGIKEDEIITGVDVSYIEPVNHFKREVIRVDAADINDGTEKNTIDNIISLDLMGVTRRSQAMRAAQYQIAASKYLRRSVSFDTSTDAISLAPGDVISISAHGTGIAYGYGGKVVSNSAISTTEVTLEHFTVPAITDSVFTANTNPIALRVLDTSNDKQELYILSNSAFTTNSTGNTSSGADIITVNVTGRFDTISKTLVSMSGGFTANNTPSNTSLWSLGEVNNPNDYFSSKAGKLFKVTSLSRESDDATVTVSGIEYISNVYSDSDTFIDYQPIAYTDILSPLTPPPAPTINFYVRPRRDTNGSIVYDGIIDNTTDRLGFAQSFSTEYSISFPISSNQVIGEDFSSNVTILTDNVSNFSNNTVAVIRGKNGFTTPIGEVILLCNSAAVVDGNIVLTVEGLSSCTDDNFAGQNIIDVNAANAVSNLKGFVSVSLPVEEKSIVSGALNFIGYDSHLVSISRPIIYSDSSNNIITVANKLTGVSTLYSKLPNPPFLLNVNQFLQAGNYSNNSFYVSGTTKTNITEGLLSSTIVLDNNPRDANSVRFFVDGKLKNTGQYLLNLNHNIPVAANIEYTATATDTFFRAETDTYKVPTIEVGDTLQVARGNIFSVANSSYDDNDALFDAALTSNAIYKITLTETPAIELAGASFINTTSDFIGSINNSVGTAATFDYNTNAYPSTLNLLDKGIYTLDVDSIFSQIDVANDPVIENLPIGTTIIQARNTSIMGRKSPYVSKSVTAGPLPIQKVDNLEITESLYREQTSGVSVRVTCSFDHILGQEVTDYEISYKLSNVLSVGDNDGGSSLTSFNTVKVSADGIDSDGKIRFTVTNINRGLLSGSTSITFRVTPLNNNTKGLVAEKTSNIIGKTATPANIYGLTGGQQDNQITLFWQYERINDELKDLDLKEVVIRRLAGAVDNSLENFLAATPLVTVSAGTARKSIPIDNYSTFTYLVRTRDTSGNFSDSVQSIVITSTRPKRNTVVAAYSEDDPSVNFTELTNVNTLEYYFPSFANSNTGGLAYSYASTVDNANGTSSGFSSLVEDTDLSADAGAEYITQLRDFGQVITGSVSLEVNTLQTIQTTWNDQHEEVYESTSEVSASANIFTDTSFGGIGHVLGFSNALNTSGRYDNSNKTWMTGDSGGNVWGVWNHGQFVGDTANSNSYSLIAGLIDHNTIALGSTFYANGVSTGSNSLSNLSTVASTYTLVNFTQYVDLSPTATFVGDIGVISSQTQIRTASSNPYYANGNVNTSAFTTDSTSDGFIPYEAGVKSFRYFQLKYIINNSKPNEYDFTIDKFRYTIDKEQTIFSDTISYNSDPTVVNYANSAFLSRPVISYAILDQIDATANPAIVVTTAASNTELSFKLIASDGTGEYQANSTANVMITVVGV